MKSLHRIGAAAGLCLGACVAACLDHPLKPVNYDTEGVGSGETAITVVRDVDILFVIDNSGSMAEEQATLARNFERFVAALEETEVDANYRIGITTTDAGHGVYCGTTGPEKGRLQASSCLDRRAEFVFPDEAGTIDSFDDACGAICRFPGLETLPTATLNDPAASSRPWIERIAGVTNLPEGVSPSDAFECFGPQGIAGGGFEAPLEAMRQSLTRTFAESEPGYGFVRPGAILSVVFVTDEEDCSARQDDAFDTVWRPDGNHVFWSEQNADATAPTSEVCWFAGVECSGGPGQYDDCQPANFGVDGAPADPDHGVLYDVQQYVEFLQDLEDDKRRINPTAQVLVAVLGGVPSGYDEGMAEITYADAGVADADFQRKHGIGPGCASAAGRAVPPVRLRAFADAFALSSDARDRNLYSVCADDYAPALQQIADAITQQIAPACMPVCVADTDITTAELDPQCTVTELWRDLDAVEHEGDVPPCGGSWGVPEFPAGAEVCYRLKTDRDAGDDDDTADDLDPDCIAQGYNVEFEVLRTGEGERPAGSSIQANCIVSQLPERDCPSPDGVGSDST